MTIGEVTSYCDALFHPEYQEDYDNAGFLLGRASDECRGVLVAIDLTPSVIDEAAKAGLNLIITHHPFIFSGIKRITSDNETGRMVFSLIENGIAVYAAHTNLDNLKNGVNGILSAKLGLSNTAILKPLAGHDDVGAGMVGELSSPMDLEDFCLMVKQRLGLKMLRCSPSCIDHVHRVALCGGAGAFLINQAIGAKADVFLTADLKYHDFQKAEGRIVLIDAGHYESEQFAKELIYSAISEKFSKFACQISRSTNSYINYI